MKGKHAQRAQARREAESQARIVTLENELKIVSDQLADAKRQIAKKEGLAAALDLAVRQADELTSPVIDDLLGRVNGLEAKLKDANGRLGELEGVADRTIDLLVKHEGMTMFEALEFLGIEAGITSEMVMQRAEKKMSPEARRAYQKAKGLRRNA